MNSIRAIGAKVGGLKSEIVWVACGQIAAALGSLIGVRLLTSSLKPSSYGEFALGSTVALLTQQALIGPLAAASLRFFGPSLEARRLAVFLAAVRRLLVSTIAVTILLAAGVGTIIIAGNGRRWALLLTASTLLALLLGWQSTLDSLQNAARHRKICALHDALGSWTRYGVAAALVWLVRPTSSIAMLGFATGIAIVLISQTHFYRRDIVRLASDEELPDPSDVRRMTGKMWAYAWPFATWGMFSWAQLVSDTWGLQLARGRATVGIYNALYQVGYYPVLIATNAMVQLLAPLLFARAGDGSDAKRLWESQRAAAIAAYISVLLACLGAILAFTLRNVIFHYLVGARYRPGSGLLAPLVLAGGMFAAAQIAATSTMAQYRTEKLILPKILTSVAGAIVNVAAALQWGLPGVVYGNLAFSALYLVWMLHLNHVGRGWRVIQPDDGGTVGI